MRFRYIGRISEDKSLKVSLGICHYSVTDSHCGRQQEAESTEYVRNVSRVQVGLWVNEQEGNPSASRTHGATGLAAANAKHQVPVLSDSHVRPQAVDEARWGEIRPYLRS